MFSTMMTEESTMMPKSTAPIDSRFADLPRRKRTEKAKSRASGRLMAMIRALRTWPRNISRTIDDERHAEEEVLPDRLGGDVDEFVAVVVGDDLDARQEPARGPVQLLDLRLDGLERRQRVGPLAEHHEALDGIVLVDPDAVVLPLRPHRRGAAEDDPAESRLAADDDPLLADFLPGRDRPAFDDVLDADRDVVRRGEDDLPDLADPPSLLGRRWSRAATGSVIASAAAPGPALADEPEPADHLHGLALDEVVAADVGVARAIASCNCLSVMPYRFSRSGSGWTS